MLHVWRNRYLVHVLNLATKFSMDNAVQPVVMNLTFDRTS
eukprot:SAG11_NODE_23340_length_390_cov_1.615120_1_plen_39_part_01